MKAFMLYVLVAVLSAAFLWLLFPLWRASWRWALGLS